MKKLLRLLYSRYCLLVFALIFLVLTPLFWISIQRPTWKNFALKLNHWWALWFFRISRIPRQEIYQEELSKDQPYVFCPNHTSFLDIPLLGLNGHRFVFVGKSSIAKVPLFGYMYKKIHITVDRSKLKSKYRTLKLAKEQVEQGRSLVMFPEGGSSKNPPNLSDFKDGPFRVAIEQQIPVVPVTIPYNWIILPNHPSLMVNRTTAKIIYHAPIVTTGMDLHNLDQLKQQVNQVIAQELTKHSV